MVHIGSVEVLETIQDADKNIPGPNLVLRKYPPSNAKLNIKLIYNKYWRKACCATKAEPNGNEAEAKQRALDVYKKAKGLCNSDDNGLRT